MKEDMMKQTRSEKATQGWVLVLTSLASFMIGLDALVVTTALSTIRLHLGASIEELEWTVNSYTLSFAVLLLTGSALGDRFGRRRIFVLGLVLFTGASATCALAPTIGWLIAARTVQGGGAALVMPLAVTLVSAAFPPQSRARALGIFSGTAGLAVLSGPVVGGAIAQGFAWQWVFWLNVPIGLIVIPLILCRVPESFGARTRFDIGGLLIISGAVLGAVWGLVRGNSAGWSSLEVIVPLVGGFLLALAFIVWELRAHVPMLPMRLFRSRTFSAGNAAGFFLFASLYGSTFFLAQFLQTAQGYGPLGAGLRLLPWTLSLSIVAPTVGFFINRVGERTLAVCGLLLQAIGMAWIALVARPDLPYIELVVPLIITGCGASMVIPTTQNAVMGSVAANEIGKASGTFNMLRQLGAAFGVAILGAVFAAIGGFGTAQIFSNGFVPAMIVSAALSLIGAIAATALPGRSASISVQAPAKTETIETELPTTVEPAHRL